MTFEIDKSGTRNVDDKEKKPGLIFVDESDIKKLGREGSELREDPKIKLVDKADTRRVGEKVKKPRLEFVAKEHIINCERLRVGITNNCVICNELSRDIFDRCQNKYGGI